MHPRLISLIAASTLVAVIASAEEPREDRHVILVSVDGLAHHYFDDPKCHMPTIRGLAAKGARAKWMGTSFPTVTWPNHTTLVTGVHAGRHGVIGNNFINVSPKEIQMSSTTRLRKLKSSIRRESTASMDALCS